MDKNIQQAMLPGSTAWFLEKKPVRILNILAIVMSVIFLVFSFWAIINEDIIDSFTGVQLLIFFIYFFTWITVAIVAGISVSHDKAIYIKENGYMFKVVPMSNSSSGVMYGGLAGGLIGAAIGAAVDSAAGGNVAASGNVAAGAGVLGMAHTRIGAVSQITGISQIDDKDGEYLVTATLVQHLKGGKTTKPKEQKLKISKMTLAIDSLMAELSAIR